MPDEPAPSPDASSPDRQFRTDTTEDGRPLISAAYFGQLMVANKVVHGTPGPEGEVFLEIPGWRGQILVNGRPHRAVAYDEATAMVELVPTD